MPSRRPFVLALAALLMAGTAHAGDCDALHGRQLRFVVPTGPGGGYDQVARALEPFFEKATGAEVVVDNVTGGGGKVAYKQVRAAAPDGSTVALAAGASLIFAETLGEPGDPRIDEFHLLGGIDEDTYLLMVATDSPIRTVDDLWNGTLGHPVVFGNIGLSNSLVGLAAAELLGTKVELVPAQSSQAGNLALIRGEVDVVARTTDSARQMIAAGEARPILAIASAPVEGLPELALLGGPDGQAARRVAASGLAVEEAVRRAEVAQQATSSLRVMIAPAGLPPEIARCLESLVTGVARGPDVAAALAAQGRAIDPRSAAELEPLRALAAQSAGWLKPLAEQARAQSGS